MSKIKVTSNFLNRVRNRLIMLFGRPVVIGRTYGGVVVGDRMEQAECRAALYEDTGLVLAAPDNRAFTLVSGDIAVHSNMVYADNYISRFYFNVPVTAETSIGELRRKMPFAPPGFLKMIMKSVS